LCIRPAASRIFCTAGRSSEIKMPIMAITTNNSMRVKAARVRRDMGEPPNEGKWTGATRARSIANSLRQAQTLCEIDTDQLFLPHPVGKSKSEVGHEGRVRSLSAAKGTNRGTSRTPAYYRSRLPVYYLMR